MKTRKPITTISYNSESFLKLKLEELRKAKIISIWFFIEHQPEEDEKKAHKHLWVMPAKTIQTDDLVDELLEPDPKHDKPLKCLHFQSCNSFSDWYLYSIHDPSYLMRKGQKRKYSYMPEQFVCSDRDELEEMVHEIDMTDYTAIGRMVNAIEQGESFSDYIRRGAVPVQLFKQYQAAWEFLVPTRTQRNGRETHTPVDSAVAAEMESRPQPSSDGLIHDYNVAYGLVVDPSTGAVLLDPDEDTHK